MSVSVSRHEKGWWQRTDGAPGRGVRGGACVSRAGALPWKPEEGADRRRVTQLPRGGKRPLALDPGNSGAWADLRVNPNHSISNVLPVCNNSCVTRNVPRKAVKM